MVVNRNQAGRTVFGAVAIALGFLFLLDNLDFIDARAVLHYWPAIFMVLGLLKIIQTRSPQGVLVGGALLVVGSVMVAGRLGLIGFSWRSMWPLFLILAGVVVVFKPSRWRHNEGSASNDDARIDIISFMGGVQRSVQSQQFRGGEITSIMGGCELDLRNASIEGEAVLEVFTMWGGIEIKVPTDWTVVMQGMPLLGGFEEKTLPPAEKNKRLVVKGYSVMGGVEIRN